MARKKTAKSTEVRVGKERRSVTPRTGTFSGPAGVETPLRIDFSREAYAGFIHNTRTALDREVCGVLLGQVCEDREGTFVTVEAVIEGLDAREDNTSVTFTQATWTHIHAVREQSYPNLAIVGWYHTHPGFGVVFSDMDVFVHKSFFSLPTQIALVIDPLSGAVATAIADEDGLVYIDRIWVDGRAVTCRVPRSTDSETHGTSLSGGAVEERLERLEARLSALSRMVEEQARRSMRVLWFCGYAFLVCLALGLVHFVWRGYVSIRRPPELLSYVPVPVEIEGKRGLIGIEVKHWQLPPELEADFRALAIEELKREAARSEAERREAEQNGDEPETRD